VLAQAKMQPTFQPLARLQRLAAVIIAVGALVSACSEELVGGKVIGTKVDAGPDGKFATKDITGSQPETIFHDLAAQDLDDDSGLPPIDANREIIVLLNTAIPQIVKVKGELVIPVKIIDYNLPGPAPNVAVTYEIVEVLGPGAPGDGAINTDMTVTDEDGLTGVKFSANAAPSLSYKIKISCEGAQDAFVDITVSDLAKGDLRVTFLYDNLISLGQVAVRVIGPPFTCATFKPTLPPVNPLATQTVGITAKPVFKALAADKKYGVFVTAKDTQGHLAAAGCADAVYVVDKQTTELTLSVSVLPLQASGPYDMVNHFDFTGAIPGQLGQILDTAVQLFYDPGTFIIQQVKNLVKSVLPGIVVDVAFGLFEDALAKVVTDWLLNSSPAWLQSFFQMGQDVLQVVKKLEMTGILKLFKVQNDFFVTGEIDFTGVNLYWKLGCDKTKPDYEECGKLALDLKMLTSDPNLPMNLISGKLTGSISKRDQLDIDSGKITLNYGKLILYVLNNVILYKITGKKTMKDAMAALVNCPGIGKGIGGSILGKLGLSASDVEKFCSDAVGLLVLPVETALNGLALDSHLSLTGKCTMVDDNEDLKVDKLVNGVWVGHIEADTPGKGFKGDFKATRQAGF